MSFIPRPQEIYKHFKGNLYQVMAVATHSETDEQLVIYQAMYGDFKIYARPLDMFVSPVDKEKYPDAVQEFRFELQGGDSGRQRAESESVTEKKSKPEQDDVFEKNSEIDPMVMEFLDSDSYSQKLNILAGLHHRITDEMITTMAVACDIEVSEGDTESRYLSLTKCLRTLDKYECNRLR